MTEGETRGAIFTRGAIDETTVRIVDALFRHFAKQVSSKNGISIGDVIDASWLLLERGGYVATGMWHDALVRKGSRFGLLAEGSGYEDYLVGVIVVIGGDSKLMDEFFIRLP
jgi:hypothetical protein